MLNNFYLKITSEKNMMLNLKVTIFLCAMISITTSVEFIPSHLQNDYGDALEAIFSMGVKLEALLHTNASKTQNFVVSPLSLTLLLGQLMLGAEGKFQDHLYELVSLSQHDARVSKQELFMRLHLQLGRLVNGLHNSPHSSYTLDSTNALFINKNIQLKPAFEHESNTLYKTQIYPLNFKRSQQAMQTINKWAGDHTNGLIQNIVNSPPGPNTAAIFANALYFRGKWEQPFSSELNHVGPFYTSTPNKNSVNSVSVTYMVNFLEQVPYAESKRLNCKLLVIPYENRELGMYIVLPNVGDPDEYNINKFASRAKTSDYLELLGNLKDRDVSVKIPKFSLSSSLSLLQPLQMYASYKKYIESHNLKSPSVKGNKNVLDTLDAKKEQFENFTKNLNQFDEILLSGASYNGDLKVSDVLQQMTFSLNEVGTEAAAVSAGIVDYSGGSKSFMANKPFMFFIRHEATAATLFWGTISNPS